ncbi:MAG: TetR/AcrR family transcriptional regulator [Streptosporangiaceae bacterium]
MVTQTERTAAAREAIIAAAIAVLGSEGHRALTNTRLQEVSGHSRGLVSYHFGSRQGLLEAVIGSIRDDFLTDLVQPPDGESMSGVRATVQLIDTYLRELRRDPRRNLATLALTVASLRELPQLQQAIRELNDDLRAGVRDLLTRGIEDRTVRPDADTTAAAGVVIAMLRGATIQWLADPDAFDIDTARQELSTVITRSYGSG